MSDIKRDFAEALEGHVAFLRSIGTNLSASTRVPPANTGSTPTVPHLAAIEAPKPGDEVDAAIKMVAAYYGVKETEICVEKRGAAPVVAARQVVMYLLNQVFGLSQVDIGKDLDRDSSTVNYACHMVAKKRASDSRFDHDLALLQRKLSPATALVTAPMAEATTVPTQAPEKPTEEVIMDTMETTPAVETTQSGSQSAPVIELSRSAALNALAALAAALKPTADELITLGLASVPAVCDETDCPNLASPTSGKCDLHFAAMVYGVKAETAAEILRSRGIAIPGQSTSRPVATKVNAERPTPTMSESGATNVRLFKGMTGISAIQLQRLWPFVWAKRGGSFTMDKKERDTWAKRLKFPTTDAFQQKLKAMRHNLFLVRDTNRHHGGPEHFDFNAKSAPKEWREAVKEAK